MFTDNIFFLRLSTLKSLRLNFFQKKDVRECVKSVAWESLRSPGSELIDRDRGDNYHADYYFLNEIGPTHLLATVTQKSHDQGADHCAQNCSLAAAQTTPTNDHRGNNVQFRAGGNRRIALPQARHLHYTRQAKE